MMKESRGYVTSVSVEGKAQVMVEMDDSAKGCSSQVEHCHCAGKGRGLAVKVENRAGAKVGDYVSVLFKPGAILKSVFILIGIPSLGILSGTIAGTTLNESSMLSLNQAFTVGAACFAVALLGAVLIYREISPELQPFVDRIISSGDGARVFAAIDPVCGNAVDPLRAAGKIDYEGRTYHFCQAACLNAFIKEPHRYLGDSRCAQCAGPQINISSSSP
jgi:YHS domain-containing protein/positive regulator of sigma E activity